MLVEILEIVAWPVMVAVVTIFFIWVLRDSIGDSIRRVKSIDKKGVSMDSTASQPEGDKDKQEQKIQNLCDEMASKLLMEREQELLAALEEEKLEVKYEGTEKVLIKAMASLRITADFEKIYGFIYGSQVHFLRWLNQSGRLSREQVKEYFEDIKSGIPDLSNSTEEGYYAFLFNSHLIEVHEEVICITEKGKEYLAWQARIGKPDNRPN